MEKMTIRNLSTIDMKTPAVITFKLKNTISEFTCTTLLAMIDGRYQTHYNASGKTWVNEACGFLHEHFTASITPPYFIQFLTYTWISPFFRYYFQTLLITFIIDCVSTCTSIISKSGSSRLTYGLCLREPCKL